MKEIDKRHNTEATTKSGPMRDEEGKWLPGHSGNAGGWGSVKRKHVRELSQLVRSKTDNGAEIVEFLVCVMRGSITSDAIDSALGHLTAEEKKLILNVGVRERVSAAALLLERGFGRPVDFCDLADIEINRPSEFKETTSPNELLGRSMKILSKVIDDLEQQVDRGESLDVEGTTMLSESTKILSVLAKEERELSKSEPGASLSDYELRVAVIGSLSNEELTKALNERGQRSGN